MTNEDADYFEIDIAEFKSGKSEIAIEKGGTKVYIDVKEDHLPVPAGTLTYTMTYGNDMGVRYNGEFIGVFEYVGAGWRSYFGGGRYCLSEDQITAAAALLAKHLNPRVRSIRRTDEAAKVVKFTKFPPFPKVDPQPEG